MSTNVSRGVPDQRRGKSRRAGAAGSAVVGPTRVPASGCWGRRLAALALERLEPLAPRRPDAIEPLVELGQPGGIELVDPLLGGDAHGHEACLAQGAEVLGERKVRRCWEIAEGLVVKRRAISPAESAPRASISTMRRLVGSAMASKTVIVTF
jgi:hypothetical protein